MTPTLATTPSNSFRYPTAANNGSDFGTGLQDLADDVDGMWIRGTIASLPTASTAGRRYYATDLSQELYDTGSSWIPVGSATPVGTIAHYAGSSDPVDADGTTRWLVCDGRAISRTTYATLFAKTSTTYGSGNGTTTFNIPDGRGRALVGADPTGVHLPVNEPALGASGGEEQHTLSTAEIPAHTHPLTNQATATVTKTAGGDNVAGPPVNNSNTGSNTGGGGAHNNLQPYLAVQHIIKVL